MELAQLRRAAGLSTYELAERLQVSQSKVSKIENGRIAVSVVDVRAWAEATGHADRMEQLSQRAEAALTEAVAWRGVTSDGLAGKQFQVSLLERTAAAIRVFDPLVVPCLLQTAEYARHIYLAHRPEGRADVAQAVAQRLERQSILYDESRELEFVVAEAALLRRLQPPSVALAQLDRIRSISTLRNVAVGIIPLDAEVAWFGHGFTLFEGLDGEHDLVLVETLTAGLNVSDPRDVATYRTGLARLRESAAFGDQGRAIVERIFRELRILSDSA